MKKLGKNTGNIILVVGVVLVLLIIIAVNAILFSKTMLKMNSRTTNIKAELINFPNSPHLSLIFDFCIGYIFAAEEY